MDNWWKQKLERAKDRMNAQTKALTEREAELNFVASEVAAEFRITKLSESKRLIGFTTKELDTDPRRVIQFLEDELLKLKYK